MLITHAILYSYDTLLSCGCWIHRAAKGIRYTINVKPVFVFSTGLSVYRGDFSIFRRLRAAFSRDNTIARISVKRIRRLDVTYRSMCLRKRCNRLHCSRAHSHADRRRRKLSVGKATSSSVIKRKNSVYRYNIYSSRNRC